MWACIILCFINLIDSFAVVARRVARLIPTILDISPGLNLPILPKDLCILEKNLNGPLFGENIIVTPLKKSPQAATSSIDFTPIGAIFLYPGYFARVFLKSVEYFPPKSSWVLTFWRVDISFVTFVCSYRL